MGLEIWKFNFSANSIKNSSHSHQVSESTDAHLASHYEKQAMSGKIDKEAAVKVNT